MDGRLTGPDYVDVGTLRRGTIDPDERDATPPCRVGRVVVVVVALVRPPLARLSVPGGGSALDRVRVDPRLGRCARFGDAGTTTDGMGRPSRRTPRLTSAPWNALRRRTPSSSVGQGPRSQSSGPGDGRAPRTGSRQATATATAEGGRRGPSGPGPRGGRSERRRGRRRGRRGCTNSNRG